MVTLHDPAIDPQWQFIGRPERCHPTNFHAGEVDGLLGGGVRVELPAHLYESVADLVSREIECCGNWLELSLARKFDRLDLTLISKTEAGVTDIRSLVGLRTD